MIPWNKPPSIKNTTSTDIISVGTQYTRIIAKNQTDTCTSDINILLHPTTTVILLIGFTYVSYLKPKLQNLTNEKEGEEGVRKKKHET